jgi:hypothetical protein
VLYCGDATHKLYSHAVTDSALVARLTWAARFTSRFVLQRFVNVMPPVLAALFFV